MKTIVTVLIADGQPDSQGDIILKSGVTFGDMVSVRRDFKNDKLPSGSARLFWEGDILKAEIDLQDVDLDAVKAQMTPAIGGRILEREGSTITQSVIDTIAVQPSANADPRVKKIGDQ